MASLNSLIRTLRSDSSISNDRIDINFNFKYLDDKFFDLKSDFDYLRDNSGVEDNLFTNNLELLGNRNHFLGEFEFRLGNSAIFRQSGLELLNVNLKTINGGSLLGEGDIELPPPNWGNIEGDIEDQIDLIQLFDNKQDNLIDGSGTTINGVSVDLGGVLNAGDTIIKGALTNDSTLFLGGNAAGENLIQLMANAQSIILNLLTSYDGSGGGQIININPGGFESVNYLADDKTSSVSNSSFGSRLTYSDNRIIKLLIDLGGIAAGSSETFTLNGVTFTEGVDFVGQNDAALDALELSLVDYSSVADFVSVEVNGFELIFTFSEIATVSATFTNVSILSKQYNTEISAGNDGILLRSNNNLFVIDDAAGEHKFYDGFINPKGIQYGGNYDATLEDDSLVPKRVLNNALINKLEEVVEDTTPQLGGDLDLNNNDITGTGNIDITGNVISDVVQLRGGVDTQGEMSWNTDEETVQLIMDGTTLYLGQDTFVHVRNNTASIITKGTAVYATGTLGASGRITVAPMIADGSIPGRYFIGLAAENITAGVDGQVITFGKIRQINTNSYNNGDVLWISPTVAGQLTTTEPTAPNLKIATAFVIHAATNGTLMVRAEQGTDLHTDQRVQVSGLINGDVLMWSNVNQRWENKTIIVENLATNNLTQTAGQDREYNLNARKLTFLQSLELNENNNKSLAQLSQFFTTSVNDSLMNNNSIAPLLDATTLDLYWKYKNNIGVVSDLFAKVDKSKLYGGVRYTLVKPNGTQQYYNTLTQVTSNWADGDTLHQFADETVNWQLVSSEANFILPAINWNGNGFKFIMQNFTVANNVGFLVASKTVNIYNLNFEVNINNNNVWFIRTTGTSVLNLHNVTGVQTNTVGFGVSTYIFDNQNTSVINGYNTIFNSLSTIVISGSTATVNAYIGVSTSTINGVTFNNFRFAENLRGLELKLNVARLFGSCIITGSRFNQAFNTTALEGISSGTFIFNACTLTYNTTSALTIGTFNQITYNGCVVNNLQACEGSFTNMISTQMTWLGQNTITVDTVIQNSFISSSSAQRQIRVNSGSLTIRNSTLIHNDATASNTNIIWLPNIVIDIQDSALINLNSGSNISGSGLNAGWGNTYMNKGNGAIVGIDGYTNAQLRQANKYRLTHNQDYAGNTGLGLVSPYPAMTTAERSALTNVYKGYEIENTTINHIERFDGTAFKKVLDLMEYTTAEMNAIVSPPTNMLVFNTELNGIYRYNGSAWVSLTSGYGVIGVQSGSGNGTPTFFADLQSALETCKASGGYFTVTLYSNLTITSAIEIDYTGSGVGFAYQFRQLTIDFNGFSVTNAQADSSHAFDIRPSNNVAVHQEVRFLNGSVIRTNGTGTHYAFKFNQAGRLGTVQMNKMFWFCQNSDAAVMNISPNSTQQGIDRFCDLGGSTFVSQNGNGIFVDNSTIRIKNFSVIVHGSGYAFGANSGDISYFTAENTSTGRAISASGTVKLRHFEGYTNSGTGLFITNGIATNFYIKSISGRGIDSDIAISCTVTNFTVETGNNYALKVLGSFSNNNNFSNGKCINNGATQCVQLQNFGSGNNIEAMNYGSGIGLDIRNNQNSRAEVTNCKGISIGGIGGYINSSGAGNVVKVDNCCFISDLNTSSGHAVWVDGSSQSTITKSHFIVRNSGANAINATSAVTVGSRYCTHNDVASTPINANVTIVSSGIIS